jgi:riboflavin biosynthesis pyrimidine reductase
MRFRQLWPQPAEVTADGYVKSLQLADHAGGERPYTVVNFVSTLDGQATFHGRSRPLGDEGDKHLFHALRAEVDAVMAGTGTLAIERYGRIIPNAEVREQRRAQGLTPEPVAVTLTRSGMVPRNIPLFDEPEAEVVVYSHAEVDLTGTSAHVDVVQLPDHEPSFTAALRHLRTSRGVRSLLCEGGPSIFSALLHEGVVDEFFLTLSATLTGGNAGPSLTSGPELPDLERLSLAGVLQREDTLFLRYRSRN